MNIEKICKKDINIYEIIKNESIKVQFQPIIFMNRKIIFGVEGLVRGINRDTNQLISPIDLFEAANENGVTIELDRICREKVIEEFSYIHKYDKNKYLFLNIDASILEKVEGSKYLLSQIRRYDIETKNIVIEINESKIKDNDALKKFIRTYKKLGFLIAMDDVGAGFSNLDRIPISQPDIIKIDMSLIRNIHKDYYKQEVFKALVSLSNKIGAVVVAEGAELEEEALKALNLGANMIQGYYFSKPQDLHKGNDILLDNSIEKLSDSFKVYTRKLEKLQKENNKSLNYIVNNVIKEISKVSSNEFDEKLFKSIRGNKTIECAYIIDKYGTQISNTIYSEDEIKIKENGLFFSATIGNDHSMKKYYYRLINAKISKYITKSYVSMATGNICITVSKIFNDIYNNSCILCLDFKYKYYLK